MKEALQSDIEFKTSGVIETMLVLEPQDEQWRDDLWEIKS